MIRWSKVSAMAVHVYTASGIVPAGLAAMELCDRHPDIRWVFAYLLMTTLIDATDGPLARWLDVKRNAPQIDGRTIDDLLDYLTFAFLPLLAVWRMGYLADGWSWVWMAGALASLLGFAHVTAKDESGGFFRGFPSYWNIYAFYAGLMSTWFGPVPATGLLLVLVVMTVSPVWFLYPNLTPRPWRVPILVGAAVWSLAMLAMLPSYPEVRPLWWILSLIYPAFYVGLSWWIRSRPPGFCRRSPACTQRVDNPASSRTEAGKGGETSPRGGAVLMVIGLAL